jgi:aspartate aminotransferase
MAVAPSHTIPSARLSRLAGKLKPSGILKIAGEIRALQASGQDVCDLTVGDFDPQYFKIPDLLRDAAKTALDSGKTNYPPSSGLPQLREAVVHQYARDLGLTYSPDSVLVAAGARPLIYALFRVLVDPGDRVVYPAPCWNYPYYADLLDASGEAVSCDAADQFQPRGRALARVLRGARLLALNTPLNPTGTVTPRAVVREIADVVLEENASREARGERPLFVMYDHIYWMLSFGVPHATPVGEREGMARYTIFIDGVSKAFAATGLRVGWALGPEDVIATMNTFLMHVGAWAPKPEQTAAAVMLTDAAAIAAYHATLKPALEARLFSLHAGFQRLKAEGLPVDSIEPSGAIYLSARVHPFGKRTRKGATIETNEDVRRFLLDEAAMGVVPFQAFGVPGETGWVRLSVGSVSEAQVTSGLDRLGRALRGLGSD